MKEEGIVGLTVIIIEPNNSYEFALSHDPPKTTYNPKKDTKFSLSKLL